MYDYSPESCLIKDIDGQLYNIIDLWKGIKQPVDPSTIQRSYAPRSCLVENIDGTTVNVIDTILSVANGSGAGTSCLQEVIQARNEYRTLDERLDKENMKVYETINSKDFLPFKGEYITVPHSKVGFTKDMKIEGMTYHNLFPSTHEGKIVLTNATFDNSSGIITFSPVKNDFCNSWEHNLPFYKPNTTYTIVIDILENTLVKTAERPDNHAIITVGQYERESVLGNNGFELKVLNGVKGKYIKKVQTMDDFSIMSQNFGIRLFLMDAFDSGVLKFKLMILEGDYTHHNSYIPAYFKGIKSVAEKESKISILSNGKNLVDIKKFKDLNSYTLSDIYKAFLIKETQNPVQYFYKIKKIKEFPTDIGDYLFAFSNAINVNDSGSTYEPFVSCANGKIERFYETGFLSTTVTKLYATNWMQNRNEENFKKVMDCIEIVQIQEGKSVTEFEPYKQDKKEILIPYEFGFKGLPSGAKDTTILKEDGLYMRKKIKRKVLNGSEGEDWSLSHVFTNTMSVSLNLTDAVVRSGNEAICDKLTYVDGLWQDAPKYDVQAFDIGGKGTLNMRILKSNLETYDITGLKKYLSQNPIIIYYELATPVDYKITDLNSINLETFKDVTYISSKNEIGPVISCQAPSNPQAVVAELMVENQNLNNELEVKTRELQAKDQTLANEDDLLTAKDLDMDFRIFELEEQLTPEVAKLSMSYNSPYTMIKRCIEKGLYEKEDMLYKMNRYLHGKRLTQEEYDELKLMMG